jgi:MFS family permease
MLPGKIMCERACWPQRPPRPGGPARGKVSQNVVRPQVTSGLLQQRSFRLLWTGETISQVGNAMAVVGVPLVAVLLLHAGVFAVSLLTASAWLPWLMIGLPAGAWVDRLPARPVMIICDLASALLYASVPVTAWAGVLTIGLLVAVQFLAGVASVLFMTAYQVYLPSVVSTSELIEGNTRMQGSASAAAFAGPGLAGVVAQVLGAVTALFGNAISFLVSAACLLGAAPVTAHPPPPAPGVPRQQSLRTEITDGIRLVFGDPYLRQLSLFWSAANLALTGYTALVVIFLVRVIGLSAGSVGLLTAVPGAGGILGALLARRITARYGTARGLLVATWAALPFALLIPLTGPGPRLAWYIAGVLVAYTGIAIGNIIIAAFRQSYSPPGMCGRVTATMRVIIFATSPVGALAGGGLASWLGIRTALWILLGLAVLSGLLLRTRALTASPDLPDRPAPAGR